MGSASRNENSAAVAVDRPVSWPATIVLIDRDIPGQSDAHCPTPMAKARHGVTRSSPSCPLRPARAAQSLDDDHGHAAGDQRRRDGQRAEQVRLDGLAQREPRQRRGHEGHDERGEQLLRSGVAGEQAARALGEQDAVMGRDREHGAQLHDDLEGRHGGVVVLQAEQMPGEHQVTGGRHGEVLGDSLDDPEQDGYEERHARRPP